MKRALWPCLGTGLMLLVLGLLLCAWAGEPVQASLSTQASHIETGDVLSFGLSVTNTHLYLPFLANNHFRGMKEGFESGTDDWEPFLNYWRLKPDQWYLQSGGGYGGSAGLRHSAFLGVADPASGAHDALYVYRGEGAEQWTDYRMEALVKMEDGEQMGLWVRGKYTPDAAAGLHVEGYYVSWQPEIVTDSVTLWRIPNSGSYAYNFAAAEVSATGDRLMSLDTWYRLAVQVHGPNIQVFVDGDRVLECEDSTYDQGTVGLYTYKADYATWDNVTVLFQD